MNSECGVVEIAFGLETGFAYEVFVFGFTVLRRLLAEIGEKANGFEVDIKNGVGVGEQAHGIGSGTLAQ